MIDNISFPIIFQMFVLLNPMSSVPILLAAHRNKLDVRRISMQAVLVAFAVAATVAVLGPVLFTAFSISVDSFRIAGGIVLLLLGIQTVRPVPRDISNVTEADSISSLIATPMLTGPATISYITVKTIDFGRVAVVVNLTGAFVLVGIAFYVASRTISRINVKIIDIISRILGLFLTAVAIQMIANGIAGIIHSWV